MDGFAEKYVIESNGLACAENIVVDSDLRITVITPELVRIEKGGFCDLPTQTVLFRNLGKVDFSCVKESDRITVRTDKCEFCILKSGKLQNLSLIHISEPTRPSG